MGLADKAVRAVGATVAAANLEAERKLQAVANEMKVSFESCFDPGTMTLTVVSIVQEQYPVQRNRQYGGTYIEMRERIVARFTTDDVTLRCVGDTKQWNWFVERPCRDCGQLCESGRNNDSTYGPHAIPLPHRVSSQPGDTHHQRNMEYAAQTLDNFYVGLGQALTTDALCVNCRARFPTHCPSCNRHQIPLRPNN